MADTQWTKEEIVAEVRSLCDEIRKRNYTQADRLRWARELEAIVKRDFALKPHQTCKDLTTAANAGETNRIMHECRANDNFFFVLCPNLFNAMLHGTVSAQDVADIYHGRYTPPPELE